MNRKSERLLLGISCVITLCLLVFSYPVIVRQAQSTYTLHGEYEMGASYIKEQPKSQPSRDTFQNDPSFSDQNESKWEDLIKCQKIRLERLKSHCDQQSTSDIDINSFSLESLKHLANRFIADDVHKVVVKSVPKTGSTSWRRLLILNSPTYKNTTQDIDPHDWGLLNRNFTLRHLADSGRVGILHRLKSYFVMLTVRHPLARLESAFLDRLVYTGKLQRVREKNPKIFDNKLVYAYFQRFLDEFLSEQSQGMHINGHWAPYVNYSDPCLYPVSYIAKTETIEEEMEYISQTKLSGMGGALHENQRRTNSDVSSRLDGGEILPLFSGLKKPAEIIQKLERWYGLDMKLFGYGFKIEKGLVVAVCDNVEEHSKCC